MRARLVERLRQGWQLKDAGLGWWVSGTTQCYQVQMSELMSRELVLTLREEGVLTIETHGGCLVATLIG